MDFKIGTTQAKFCPLYQESSGFPLFILQHLGSAAYTQMPQIPLTDALAGKPAGHQGSCWCSTKLLCLPERTAKFHFSWEKIILDTKPTQGKTPMPLITQSDVLHPFPGGDLCPLTRVGNKASLIECLPYWFTAFQVVQDLLCPDRNCSEVWFFFLLLLKVTLCFPLVFLSSLSSSHKSL